MLLNYIHIYFIQGYSPNAVAAWIHHYVVRQGRDKGLSYYRDSKHFTDCNGNISWLWRSKICTPTFQRLWQLSATVCWPSFISVMNIGSCRALYAQYVSTGSKMQLYAFKVCWCADLYCYLPCPAGVSLHYTDEGGPQTVSEACQSWEMSVRAHLRLCIVYYMISIVPWNIIFSSDNSELTIKE